MGKLHKKKYLDFVCKYSCVSICNMLEWSEGGQIGVFAFWVSYLKNYCITVAFLSHDKGLGYQGFH